MSEECTHDCGSCSQDCAERQKTDFLEKPHPMSSIKKVIGVVSGKGGVGKSLVTSLLAVMMNRKGYHSAILDRRSPRPLASRKRPREPKMRFSP